MEKIIFEVKDVEYEYPGGIKALSGINMRINKSERIVIMGANGSGKTTLLAMLNGLIFPSQGTITAFGNKLTEVTLNNVEFARNFRQKIGFVFQNPEIQLFCPTVREDIAFSPLNFGIETEEVMKMVEKIAVDMEITNILDRPPHRLSIGEKKKVAIATALVMNPEVIIMDEPTGGLDPITTRHIINVLIKAGKDGKTIITATHDIHIVEEIADIVYILGKDKKIVTSGTPEEIFRNEEMLRNNNLIHIHKHMHGNMLHLHSHIHPVN